jgi:hypothetical protein
MTTITSIQKSFSIYRPSRTTFFFILLQISCLFACDALHAQVHVKLPLATYTNNGTTKLAPSIPVVFDPSGNEPDFITLNDGVQNWKVVRDGATVTGPDVADWLKFKGTPSGPTYTIELFVVATKCAPVISGTSDCGTGCADNIGVEYTNATARKCYTLSGTVFGNPLQAFLCQYGDPALQITTDVSQAFDVPVGGMDQKQWTSNRNSNNLKWSLTPGAVNNTYLTFEPGTDVLQATKLNYRPMSAEAGTWTLKVAGANSNLSNVDACDIPVTRVINVKATDVPPAGSKVDLVLVVDVSGSMSEKGACSSGKANPEDSKLGFVKANLLGVYNKITAIVPPAGSRVGFVTFSDNAEKKTNGGSFFNDIANPATTTWIQGVINGLAPGGSTNMGAALGEAVTQLKINSSAGKKQIILITNGMQNQQPQVRNSNGTPYIDANNNKSLDGGEEIPADIKVFTIAIFQPSTDYLDLLKIISRGDARFTDVCALSGNLDEAFASTYTNNSPKSVGYRSGNFTATNATIDYNITEKEFDKIIISLSSMSNSNISFKFEKNINGTWTDITSGGTYKQVTSRYALFTIAGLPKNVNGSMVDPQGQYRLVATSSKPDVDYFASAVVDDRGLKQATFVEIKTVRAADTFGLSTRMRYDANPVHQANATVKAVIHRPVFSFEKLMANEDVPSDKLVKMPLDREKGKSSIFKRYGLKPADGTTFEAALPLIEQKFQVLVYHKGLLGKIVQQTDTVILPEITNGVYQARYSNTRVTGLYGVEYLVTGTVPATGPFFRTASHSVPVLFGKPNRSKSDFYLFDEAGNYFLNLKPVDIYDNYLGMGKAEQISIIMSIGSSSQLLDNLDGRYVIPLNVPINQNPFVVITIAGMEFYRGYLLNIPQKRFFVSIGAGITTPLGTFNNVADPGWMAALKFGYRFNRKLGVFAEGDYFTFKDSINTHLNIVGGGAGLFYLPTSLPANIMLQLEASVGYYKPKNIDGEIGFKGGLELSKYLRTWFSLSLNSSYYRINTSPDAIEFLGTTLNAKFHF